MNTVIIKAGAIGIGVALVLVLGVYLVADAVSGPLLVTQPGSDVAEEVPLAATLGFTVLGGVAGIVLALVTRRFGRGPAIFVTVCVVALVLYGILPFTAADESATAIWLNVMHLVAAVPIVGLLARAMVEDRGDTGSPAGGAGVNA